MVWAQSPQTGPIGLKPALQAAVQWHPQVLRARGLAAAAGQELQAAQWSRYPALSGEARGEAGSRQSVLRLEQPVWTAGRISALIDSADRGALAAEQATLEAQQTALEQTASSFYEVLRWQDRLKLAEENLSEHQRLLDLIKRRADAEISPQADTLLAQARLQQALSEQLLAERQLMQARISLSQWTGQNITDVRTPPTWPDTTLADVQSLSDQALAFSPTRRKLLLQAEREAAQVRQLSAALKPTVVAGYQYTVGDLLPGASDRGRAYVGLSFQPGAGLSALNNVQAAVNRQQAAEQEVQSLARQLQQQVHATAQEIRTLSAQRAPLLALAERTEQVIESYVRQYQIGRKNWLDVLNAQREKSQARANALDTLWSLEQARFRLMVSTGEFTIEQLNGLHD